MRWIHRLRSLFRRHKLDRDLADELKFHVEMRTRENIAAGMSPEEARYAALRQFGNVASLQDQTRDAWGFAWLEALGQDLKYGLRMLGKSPGFTTVAVLTLALGIGANTAIFSLFDAVMLRSIPVREPSQLVLFRWKAHKAPAYEEYSSFGDCSGGERANPSGCSFPIPVFEQMRSEANAFSAVTAFAGPAQFDLSGNGHAVIARGGLVSGNYFPTLGVSASVGRLLAPTDDTPAAPPAVVLSYAYWQSAFGGERSAIGRTIFLNRVPFTIVGVAEPSFTNLTPGKAQDFWLPIAMTPRLDISWGHRIQGLDNWWLVLVGRLKAGVQLGQAQAAANLIFRNQVLHGSKPISKPEDDPEITLTPAQEGLTGQRGEVSRNLYLMMAAVGFILLIACANVAGLLLARATARQREIAVRLALGAGRRRILRQLLTESVMLSAAAGGLGVLFAYWGVHAIIALASGHGDRPFPYVVAPDWRVLVFTIAASLATGIVFGFAPALRSARLDLTPALKETGSTGAVRRTPAGRRFHLGDALVMAQVALSALVLVGAGLLVRTLSNLRSVNPGFDTRNILIFGLDPTLAGLKQAEIQNLYRQLQQQLAALPGVAASSYSSDALLTGSLWTRDLHVEGQPGKATVEVDMLSTGPGFFQTMRIPLLAGRTFTAADFAQAANAGSSHNSLSEVDEGQKAAGPKPSPKAPATVSSPIPVLVNATFARRYFANQNPLGKRLTKGGSEGSSGDLTVDKPNAESFEIVGVVGDTKYSTLRREIQPAVLVPLTGGGAYFELRTASDPTALIPAVRDVVNRLDDNLPLFEVRTQTDAIESSISQEHTIASLASFFGLLGLLLACVGLYGLLAYDVARRRREVGIRMALGAERRDVLKLVVGKGFRLTLAGLAAGIGGALALTRTLSSLLYGVRPADALTVLMVSLLLITVALLASYIPARRATKLDPMVALRYE